MLWDIRDAVGLNRNEKLFLFIIESRGVYRRSKENSKAEMGMGIELWRKTRDSLLSRDLLLSKPVREQPTHYRVNADVLATYVPVREEVDQDDESGWLTLADRESVTVSRAGESVEQTPSSGRSDSPRGARQEEGAAEPTPKVNKKKNKKGNVEGERKEDAPAPGGSGLSQESLSSDGLSLSLDVPESIDSEASVPVAIAPGPSASPNLIKSSSGSSNLLESLPTNALRTPAGGPAAGVRGAADQSPYTELEIQMRMRAIRMSHENYRGWKEDPLRRYAIASLDAIRKAKTEDGPVSRWPLPESSATEADSVEW